MVNYPLEALRANEGLSFSAAAQWVLGPGRKPSTDKIWPRSPQRTTQLTH